MIEIFEAETDVEEGQELVEVLLRSLVESGVEVEGEKGARNHRDGENGQEDQNTDRFFHSDLQGQGQFLHFAKEKEVAGENGENGQRRVEDQIGDQLEESFVEMEGEIDEVVVQTIDDHQVLIVDLHGLITFVQIDRMLNEEADEQEEDDCHGETTELLLFVFRSPIQMGVMFPITNGQETFDGHQHLPTDQLGVERASNEHLLCTN